jgi:NADH dehydrogenase FAD-containing subunit
VLGADGKPLAGVAPVAKQEGQYVAALLKARLRGKTVPPFQYRDFGSLATIGRKRAVAQLGRLKLTGLPAWLLWSVAHIYFLIGFRNRLAQQAELLCRVQPRPHDQSRLGAVHGQADGCEDDRNRVEPPVADFTP